MKSDDTALVVFLDANVLAKPVTRSLLMFASYLRRPPPSQGSGTVQSSTVRRSTRANA
jgi:hypothetical protein